MPGILHLNTIEYRYSNKGWKPSETVNVYSIRYTGTIADSERLTVMDMLMSLEHDTRYKIFATMNAMTKHEPGMFVFYGKEKP